MNALNAQKQEQLTRIIDQPGHIRFVMHGPTSRPGRRHGEGLVAVVGRVIPGRSREIFRKGHIYHQPLPLMTAFTNTEERNSVDESLLQSDS